MLTDFQKLIEKTQSLENTAIAIVSKVKEQNNAEKMLAVFDKDNDKLALQKKN